MLNADTDGPGKKIESPLSAVSASDTTRPKDADEFYAPSNAPGKTPSALNSLSEEMS